ncbi:hypothetical protein HYR99_16870 [Candidatus Poribacteria bacterium]|nr:hypothetical protein [Candidatus Poribacteria bacterium]
MEITVVDGKDIVNDSANIPTSPGVYAWYKRLSLDDTTETNFKSSLEEMLRGQIRGKVVPPIMEGTTKSARVQIGQRNLDLSSSKSKVVDSIKQDSKNRTEFAQLVLRASVLQSPLYVGKADNLRQRIHGHVSGRSDFSKYIAHYLNFSEMVLSYLEIADHLPSKTNELLEVLIACVSAPLHSERMG